MYIESLELKNYRNYESLNVQFSPETNILYGDNAQGKTNILESVYLCGTTKSHRGSKDRDIIKFGEEDSHIRMIVNKDHINHKIDMHLKKNRSKGIAVDGIPIKKASELFGIVNMVFFSPEDLNIIKNGPAERRRFLDLELCQLHKIYLQDLTAYNKVLNQRNKLLKDLVYSPYLLSTLDVWDMQLITYGKKIISMRKKFIRELSEIITRIHGQLTGGKETITLQYEPNVEEESFFQQLKKARDKDMTMKMSSVGPHRDDFAVQVNGIDIRKFGSQGQQRTAALSLKLSEIYLVKKIIHEDPILLLDDVLSELDSNRQNYLLNSIHNIQTLITCTGIDEFIQNQFKINKVFYVADGNINQKQASFEKVGGMK